MPESSHAATLSAAKQEELEKRLQKTARDNRIPCAGAFAIAKAMNIPAAEVGRAANKLKIRISKCQLGCF